MFFHHLRSPLASFDKQTFALKLFLWYLSALVLKTSRFKCNRPNSVAGKLLVIFPKTWGMVLLVVTSRKKITQRILGFCFFIIIHSYGHCYWVYDKSWEFNLLVWCKIRFWFWMYCEPKFIIFMVFPQRRLKEGFILIQSSKHEAMVMLSSVNVESGGFNTLVNFLGSWQ